MISKHTASNRHHRFSIQGIRNFQRSGTSRIARNRYTSFGDITCKLSLRRCRNCSRCCERAERTPAVKQALPSIAAAAITERIRFRTFIRFSPPIDFHFILSYNICNFNSLWQRTANFTVSKKIVFKMSNFVESSRIACQKKNPFPIRNKVRMETGSEIIKSGWYIPSDIRPLPVQPLCPHGSPRQPATDHGACRQR